MNHSMDTGAADIGADSLDQQGGLVTPSRRQLVVGGGFALGALLLTGCGSKKAARLPDVNFPDAPITQLPTVPAPAPVTPSPAPVRGPTIAVLPRSAWARQGVARPREIDAMNGITKITVHHDGNLAAGVRTQSEVARRIEGIRRYHAESKGWADIGYHYIIDPTGRVWEGRSARYQGAHVGGVKNEHNLGIVVMGNFDRQSPTSDQLSVVDAFVAQQMRIYRVSLSAVRTHQEVSPTACPGRNLQAYMVQTRSRRGQLSGVFNV